MPNDKASPASQATAVGTAVASASTLVLSDNGNIQHVTGTTPIDDITFPSGQVGPVLLITDAACSFVHLSGTLETDTGATIAASAKAMYTVIDDGGIVRVSSGGASPSTTANPATDITLAVGDELVLTGTGTNIDLKTTVSTDGIYEITGWGDTATATVSGWVELRPNNTTYTGMFKTFWLSMGVNVGGSSATQNAFSIAFGRQHSFVATVITSTTGKAVHSKAGYESGTSGVIDAMLTVVSEWTDTVAYTTIGTIVLTQSQTYRISVRRVA